ncbi:MAG: PIN domain-containing protein [Candidatus Pacebacteria bacterium]|nr:PIN domain-containing protein [Candidatus Paceibacterota bacterium]
MAAKKSSGSLDTNVLLRLTLNDVPAQTRAVEALLKRGGIYHIEDVALVEMVFVLEKLYRMPRDMVVDNVLAVINHEQFVTSERLFELALPMYVAQPSLSFMDCMLLAYARFGQRTPLHTFDKALVKHAKGDAKSVL